MNNAIKRLHRAKLVPAFLSIAFGIALIIARRNAMDVAVKIAAVMLMACGAGGLAMYFFGPVKESTNLMVGAIFAILGILCWVYSSIVVDLFPIFTGIGLILNGMSNLATLGNSEENAGAIVIIPFSILMIAGGILILWHPGAIENALMICIGVSYIINGIFDLIILYRVKQYLLPDDRN